MGISTMGGSRGRSISRERERVGWVTVAPFVAVHGKALAEEVDVFLDNLKYWKL